MFDLQRLANLIPGQWERVIATVLLLGIGTVHGRVIDVDMLATTLAEHGDSGLPTGKTAAFPNALLLTLPLKNTSSTGDFVLHFLRIPVLACPEKMRLEVGQAIFKATWRANAAVMPSRDNDRQAVREP